ncbi:acetate kinase [Candidatus Peregrinibacteria bacterium]|jgi:acetate kinase|nr:acetate kinase [Candidatus Peregrinibacteria bacterium]MBT7736992.1 acetate kinase [Candidatus Peregrinibacteria bacterium]
MQILVINSGSSSLKFKLFKTGREYSVLANGLVDGIGLTKCKFTYQSPEKHIGLKLAVKTHSEAIKLALETLKKSKAITNYKEIDAIGHRVVHGGEKYQKPIKIDVNVIKEIEKLIELAPLHNPANLEGIRTCKKMLPKTPQVAIFDTAFYQKMPEKAFMYAVPHELYKKNNIRRYGFHGTSHEYVIEKAKKLIKKKNPKIISCHIGNGSSITAYDGKNAVDTSMGMSPLEGIMMGTRSGSIDPSIIFFLQDHLKMKPEKVEHMLNHESGLEGFSEISSDMRDIYAKSLKKDKRALQTIELLSYQIGKYLGAYTSILGGLDAVIFTGGLGEKAFYVREQAMSYLDFLGAKLNAKKNEDCEEKISDTKSKVEVFVIPTNESQKIAQETEKLLKK